MKCPKCGCDVMEEMKDDMEDEEYKGEGEEMEEEGGEELNEEEMKEAQEKLPKVNLTLVFLKDKMREMGKFKGMLDEDEEEDDYNA